MRSAALLASALVLFATAAPAAQPPPAATDAEPAVRTSPAAEDPQVGRGNPRVREVLPGAGSPPAPAIPQSDPAAAVPAAPAASAAAPAARGSADRIELSVTQITGNAELPRVMYVVPWKRPEPGEMGGRPAKSLLDEVLEPVDRDVFRRQNRYYEALRPDAGTNQP